MKDRLPHLIIDILYITININIYIVKKTEARSKTSCNNLDPTSKTNTLYIIGSYKLNPACLRLYIVTCTCTAKGVFI